MTTPKNSTTDISPFERHNAEIVTDQDMPPVVFSDVIRALGLSGPRLEAKNLVGEVFTILRAKPFQSTFDNGNDPWFCVIKLANDPEIYTVVLGGGACTEMLRAYAQAEYNQPLQVKLEWVEGGKFGGYYQFT